MLFRQSCCFHSAHRLIIVLGVTLGSLALSGCPGSNWSNPQLATPQAPQAAITPPVTAPPVTAPPPITPPPPVEKPPAAPASVAVPAAPPPIATDGTLSTTMGGTKAGALVGTGTGALIYAIIVPTLSGTAKLIDPSTGAFTYAPNPKFSGTDRLQFTVTDSGGTSKPATVTITVNPSAIGALSAPANIGVNVEGVSYYNTAQQYVDVMHMAGAWEPVTPVKINGVGQTLAQLGKLDADGWPTQDSINMLVKGGIANLSAADPGPESYLVGKYQLSFNGKARIGFNVGAVENQKYDPTTNTTTAILNVMASADFYDGKFAQAYFGLNDTQRTADSPINTGITNLHVIRPQFAPNGTKWWDSPDQEFTNPFLASLAPFSTLRFMDWTLTNANQQADWNQRTPVNWPTADHYIKTDGYWGWNATTHTVEPTANVWTKSGQSWESAIALTNLTGKDMWINIPERATDDYVKSLATLLKQKLNPGIHVYVEYSNELWNYGFEQYSWITADTNAAIAADPAVAANYQKYSKAWANNASRAAERLVQISNDFASVWGDQAINDTIRPVFCWQTGSQAMQVAMSYVQNVYGAPAKYFYGIASAPYWTPAKITEGDSVDTILAASAASIPTWDGSLLTYTVTARYYGLHNLTYEGGPGMAGNAAVTNMVAANGDPRMGDQVTQALTGAFQNGVDMYTYYGSSGGWGSYGSWGATNDIFDLTTSKWTALQALAGKTITRTLAVSPGQHDYSLPGTINAGKPTFGVIGSALQPMAGTIGGFCIAATKDLPDMCSLTAAKPEGHTVYGYMVVVPKAGTFSVTLKIDARNSTPSSTAQFYVDQEAQGGTIAIPAFAAGTPSQPAAFNITMPAGISLIELEATSGYFGVNSIVVTANN